MNETINDRMEMLVNSRFDGNKAAFASSLGLSPNLMSSYLGKQRRSKPNVDMVTKIVLNLGVDPMWLLTGKECAKNEVHTEGDYSPASVHGNVSVADTSNRKELENKVKFLERLIDEKEKVIAEKERLIQVLMSK